MKGCDERCTYCIVPHTRGPERYRAADEIVSEVARLVAGGVREVTLLGQTVNSWHLGRLGRRRESSFRPCCAGSPLRCRISCACATRRPSAPSHRCADRSPRRACGAAASPAPARAIWLRSHAQANAAPLYGQRLPDPHQQAQGGRAGAYLVHRHDRGLSRRNRRRLRGDPDPRAHSRLRRMLRLQVQSAPVHACAQAR